jgi:hypothetical protein
MESVIFEDSPLAEYLEGLWLRASWTPNNRELIPFKVKAERTPMASQVAIPNCPLPPPILHLHREANP